MWIDNMFAIYLLLSRVSKSHVPLLYTGRHCSSVANPIHSCSSFIYVFNKLLNKEGVICRTAVQITPLSIKWEPISGCIRHNKFPVSWNYMYVQRQLSLLDAANKLKCTGPLKSCWLFNNSSVGFPIQTIRDNLRCKVIFPDRFHTCSWQTPSRTFSIF